jgi:hypothetical protein
MGLDVEFDLAGWDLSSEKVRWWGKVPAGGLVH